MIMQATELVPYTKATEIAAVYSDATEQIKRLTIELGEQIGRIKAVFAFEGTSPYSFGLNLEHQQRNYDLDSRGVDKLLAEFKREAWCVLFNKLEIRKLLSTKRREQWDAVLSGRTSRYNEKQPDLPEITEESIMAVLSGEIKSVGEYLQESIKELFDWLRPYQHDRNEYKTNSTDKVGRKVIRGWCVERGYGTNWRPTHTHEKNLIALDAIFHALDGKGILPGHSGPLVDAIESCGPDGFGTTEYFKFRCCKNHNIHIEFLRDDLLQLFNQQAGDASRIGAKRHAG